MATQNVIGRKNGVTADATPVVVPVNELGAPFTACIRSTTGAATLKVEVSVDGGNEYFELSYTHTTTTLKALALAYPATHIKFTGVAAAVWNIN